jgi:hypothetical protein
VSRATEPAFPAEEVHGDGVQLLKRHLGLTIREEFIKAAMQGLLAAPDKVGMGYEGVAENAIRQAETVIAAMAKSSEQQS